MKKLLSFVGLVAVIISNPVFAAIAAPSSFFIYISSMNSPSSANVTFSWVDNSNNETSFVAEISTSVDGSFTTWSPFGSVPANVTGGTLAQPYNTSGQCKIWRKYRIKAVNATESSSWATSNKLFMGGTVNCM